MLVVGCFLQDHSALVMIWFHVALTFPLSTSISGFLRLDPDLTRMRLGSNAQRIYVGRPEKTFNFHYCGRLSLYPEFYIAGGSYNDGAISSSA